MGRPEVGLSNFLGSLPISIFRDNLLLTLPPSVNNHKHLEVLLLDNNLLPEIPPVVQTLQRIQTLTVRGNLLSTPPDSVVSEGLHAILEWLKCHQPVDIVTHEEEEVTMTHARRSKSLAFADSPRGSGAEIIQQRRSRSRSLLRKDSSLVESDLSGDDEAESREAWLRSKDRRERRRSLGKRKFLKNFLVRLEEKRCIRIIRKWHAWTLVNFRKILIKF